MTTTTILFHPVKTQISSSCVPTTTTMTTNDIRILLFTIHPFLPLDLFFLFFCGMVEHHLSSLVVAHTLLLLWLFASIILIKINTTICMHAWGGVLLANHSLWCIAFLLFSSSHCHCSSIPFLLLACLEGTTTTMECSSKRGDLR